MFPHVKIKAVSEWLLEFSVLWAVFPILDSLLDPQAPAWIPYFGWIVALISFAWGLYLLPEEEQ